MRHRHVLCTTPPSPGGRVGLHALEVLVMDAVYLGLTFVLVALTWGLVRLFERVA